MAVKYTITGANGTEEVIVKGSVTDAATDTFNFSYGIAPQRMNDTVAVELLYDDQVIHSRPAFTVRDYCVEMYNESAEDLKQTANQNLIMKQLIVDMLNYGASAQLYTNYDKDNLVNAGFEAEVEDRVVEYQDIVVSDTIPGYTNTRFVSTNLYFDSSNRICFKFKATDIDNTIVTISDGSGALAQTLVPTYIPEEDAYIVATDLIDAADYDHVFTARICHVNDKGTDWESYTVIQSVSCNVNAYLAEIIRTSTDANMVKLAQAAYNYGQSASAFAAA